MVEGFCLAAVIFYIILCFYAAKVSEKNPRIVKVTIEIATNCCLCPREFPKETDTLKKLGFDIDPYFHGFYFTAKKEMDFGDLPEWKKNLRQFNFIKHISVKNDYRN